MSVLPCRIILLSAVGLLAVTHSSLAAVILNTNALANGGIETQGVNGVDGDGTTTDALYWYQNSAQLRDSTVAHSGSFSIKGTSTGAGGSYPNSVHYVNLQVAGSPGYTGFTWTSSLWAFIPTTGGLTTNSAAIKIVFLDSTFSVNLGQTYLEFLNGNGGLKDTWVQSPQLTGVIPAGASWVAFQVMQADGSATAGQTVYFDDANFTVVPEPTSVLLLGLGGICLSGVFTRGRRKA